jgi:hypothetical protein
MNYEFQNIIDKVFDETVNKHIVRFAFSNGEIHRTEILTFNADPSDEVVMDRVNIIINSYNDN